MISYLKQSLDLRRLNEASSLFSYRVTQSNSLVEAIEYELSQCVEILMSVLIFTDELVQN